MIVSSSGGGDFKPVPEGSYTAICVRVIDLGTQVTSWKGADKTQRKVLIAWEIPEVEVEYDGEVKPALIVSRYTASLSDRANLRKHLEAWRGRRFTDEELHGFDLRNVLGAPCLMQVIHNESGGSIYANVNAIMPAPKGVKPPKPHHELIHFDLSKPLEFDRATYDGFSQRLKETIAQSPEYKLATGELRHEETDLDRRGNGGGFVDIDDEIPF